MKLSLQVLAVLLCSADVVFGRYFLEENSSENNCRLNIPDLVSKYRLQGDLLSRSSDPKAPNEGTPLCPCETRRLRDLVVDVEVGNNNNKRTQREECWVGEDQNIKFVKCTGNRCANCDSSKGERRCVPITSKQSFYALCVPLRSAGGRRGYNSFVSLIRPRSGYRGTVSSYGNRYVSGYGENADRSYDAGFNEFPSEGYSDRRSQAGYRKLPPGINVRKVTLDLPTCCQCQTFNC